jgi:hypothetical protein
MSGAQLLGSFAIAISLLLCAAQTSAAVPDEIFAFDEVKIGITTLADVQVKFGKAKMVRTGQADGAPIAVCYFFGDAKQRKFVTFESGALGGWKVVTVLRVSRKPTNNSCASTNHNLTNIPGHGVQLDQSAEDFKKKIHVPFKSKGTSLFYLSETKRAATLEEVERMQAVFPKEKQIEFDVVVTIRAKFEANRLVDYLVSKTESF